MELIEIIIIAIGLALDAAAVSLAAAASGYANDPHSKFRLSFHFGFFQFIMPVIGWSLGITVVEYIQTIDHWVAFGLLSFIGIRMIISGLNLTLDKFKKDPSKGFTMVLLSFATSIDTLAVGLTLALVNVDIWYPSVIIGLITSILSLIAIHIGLKIGITFGKRMEVIGGGLLVIIGIRILISHLLQ